VRRQLGFDVADDANEIRPRGARAADLRDELTADGQPQWTVSIPSWRGRPRSGSDLVGMRSCDCMGPIASHEQRVSAPAFWAMTLPVVIFNPQGG